MKTIWNNFKVAFAMYSKIPMPPADWEKENMKYALCFFPWVGLAVGAVSAVLFWLLQQIGAGSMLRAAVLTAVPVLVTGGIHLDGYLDTMDALSSWREKQRRLEILKDPHAGAFASILYCTRAQPENLSGRFFRRMHLASQFRDRSAVFRSRFFQMPIRKEQRQRLA